jgi:hypothetical protein
MLVVDYTNVCVVDVQQRVRGIVNIDLIQKAVIESEGVISADEDEESVSPQVTQERSSPTEGEEQGQ